MKQCLPWPAAIQSEHSLACPSSKPVANVLIFNDLPSSKPHAYPRSLAASGFLSSIWRSAFFPSSKAQSHRCLRFWPSGVEAAVARKNLMVLRLASSINSQNLTWVAGAEDDMLRGATISGA